MATNDPNEGIPQLLGPGGEPLGPAPMPAAEAAPPPAQAEPAPPPARAEAPPAPASQPAPDSGQGPAYRMSALLAIDPRVIPAALITVLNHDPFEAYKRRLDAVRPHFDQSRDVMISATEAQLLRQGAPEGDHRAAATRMVEQNLMRTLWDACFETVSGAHVSLIFSAGLGGPERLAGAMLASNQPVPTVWVTTRALMVGAKFGAWAAPVTRDQEMPATVALTADNFQQLRLSFAKVRV
jgi:hypothetical protein